MLHFEADDQAALLDVIQDYFTMPSSSSSSGDDSDSDSENETDPDVTGKV